LDSAKRSQNHRREGTRHIIKMKERKLDRKKKKGYRQGKGNGTTPENRLGT